MGNLSKIVFAPDFHNPKTQKNMKKLLLTIGAVSVFPLFASAFTIGSSVGYVGGDNVSSKIKKEAIESGGYNLRGENFTAEVGQYDVCTFSFTVDCSNINLEAEADFMLFYFDASTDVGIGYDAEQDKLTVSWGSDYDYFIWGEKLTNNSEAKTFTVSFADNGTRIWTDSGGYYTNWRLRGNINNGPVSSIVVTEEGASSVDSLVFWNKDIEFANNATNTGVSSAIAAAKVAQSIVPEPSAFGLLAGIGGLALVVSRRRRK